MKKLFSIYSFLICLFVTANIYAQCNGQCYPQPYPQPCSYANHGQCVGRCEDPCVGQCDRGNWYVGAFGGANWLNYHRVDGFKPKMRVGYATALSLGYKFNNGFRVEGEFAYRNNQLKHKNVGDSYESYKLSGSTYSLSYMANVLYDFDCFSQYCPNIVPYVGVGVGYVHTHAHVKAHNDVAHISAKGNDNGVAGQAIAGVSYRLTKDTSLGVEYRYFVGRDHARDQSLGLALRQAF